MTKTRQLHTLIDMAHTHVDEAADAFRLSRQSHEQASQQLSILQDYRRDYELRLQASAHNGVGVSSYLNFTQFIATLDKAISQQNQVVAQMDQKRDESHAFWQSKKQRLSAFETLEQRYSQQQISRERKQEQRHEDELAAQMVRRQQP